MMLRPFLLLCAAYSVATFDAQVFLTKYGYHNPQSFSGYMGYKDSILSYQRFFGLRQTGIIDEETIKEMTKPRCGNSDARPSTNAYFKTGKKWSTGFLTYRIVNITPDLDVNDVEMTIQKAFDIWANVTNLKFTKTLKSYSHLTIGFYTRGHSDSNPFDGPEGVLAHAYMPTDGRVHFDEDETWVINGGKGADLLMVAVHEIGHALGLDHSDVRGSIMWPSYSGYQANLQLHFDDVSIREKRRRCRRLQEYFGIMLSLHKVIMHSQYLADEELQKVLRPMLSRLGVDPSLSRTM